MPGDAFTEATTADLSSYPDLVVIYLGMNVNSLRGLTTLLSFGPKIRKSVEAQPVRGDVPLVPGGQDRFPHTDERERPRIGRLGLYGALAYGEQATGSVTAARSALRAGRLRGPGPSECRHSIWAAESPYTHG